MESHTLLTYRNLTELRKIQDDREVFTFKFVETKNMINVYPDICIDISALVYYLQVNKNDIQAVYNNFSEMTEDTVIIVDETIAESALTLLPFLLSDVQTYFVEGSEEAPEQEIVSYFKPYSRQKVYKYNTAEDLDKIIQYATEHNIPIATFSRANGELKKEFEQFNKPTELALLDLTSVS
jgi:hypothetical protein